MIEAIEFDTKVCARLGLQGGKLRGLKELVVLAGPNGHGKSRYLRALASQWAIIDKYIGRLLRNLGIQNRSLDEVTPEEMEGLMVTLLGAFASTSSDAARRHVEQYTQRLEEKAEVWRLVQLSRPLLERVRETRRLPRLVHVGHATFEAPTQDLPLSSLSQRSVEYLQRMAMRLYLREHPGYKNTRASNLLELEAFQEILTALLDTELKCGELHEHSGQLAVQPVLFDRPFNFQELSEGQRRLLGWAILIHQEAGQIQDSILLFDEPELHLHPEVCIRAIDRLRALGPAQIWVATHSLPFLAYAGADRIFSVVNGEVSYAGSKIIGVQGALLGGKDGRDRLRGFLADADAIAVTTYATQCLVAPKSVGIHEGDPQPEMALSAMMRRSTTTQPVRVLDYAAGQGRIAQALARVPPAERECIRYYAYNDPEYTAPDEDVQCRQRVDALGQGTCDDFYVGDLRAWQIPSAVKMDAVLMCNVLHEIPPDAWIGTFKGIAQTLVPQGHLIVMEDQRISIGELPHSRGFLVLDAIEMAALFGLPRSALKEFHALGGRLTLIEIPGDALPAVTSATIRTSLEMMAQRALDAIGRCRRQLAASHDYAQGREHAFFTMLYANAHMALRAYP